MAKYPPCATCGFKRGEWDFCRCTLTQKPSTTVKDEGCHTSSHVQQPGVGNQEIAYCPTAPVSTTTTNDGPARNVAPQGYQPNTNLAAYLGPPTYGFEGNLSAHDGSNGLQVNPHLVPLPSQMLGQVPQSHSNAQLIPNWPTQVYTGPMPVFNQAMGQGYRPGQSFYIPQLVWQPGERGPDTFTHQQNQQYMIPNQGIFNNLPSPFTGPITNANQAPTPTPPSFAFNNLHLHPHPHPHHQYRAPSPTEDSDSDSPSSPTTSTRTHTRASKSTPTTTTTPANTRHGRRGRPPSYGSGVRGQRNARLHAEGLCIWCRRPNADLRRMGCPECRPRRAVTTARWRVRKARERWVRAMYSGAPEPVPEGEGERELELEPELEPEMELELKPEPVG